MELHQYLVNVMITFLVSLSTSSSSSSITLPPSQLTGAPSPLMYSIYDGAPSPFVNDGPSSPLTGSPLASSPADAFAYKYEPPSGLIARVRKVCAVVPTPEDCVGPYTYPDGAHAPTEGDVTPFNVFMRMVRDVQTSIWVADAVWTGLGRAFLEEEAGPRGRVRARALGACGRLYGRAAAEMEDVNEYNYGIDFDRANAHTDMEYAEAAEKIVDDVFEATFPATERCGRAVGNAFVGGERREAVFAEVESRNQEIKRKYANCKAMADFMADQAVGV